MADIDNTIALQGKPQVTQDIVGPITSLAQIQYMQANAQRLGVETQGLSQQQGITGAIFNAKQNYAGRVQAGEDPASAVVTSGLSGLSPTEADAAIKNVQQVRTLAAYQQYAKNPSDPYSVAGAGPTEVSAAAGVPKTLSEVSSAGLAQRAQIANEFLSSVQPDGSLPPAVRADALKKAAAIPGIDPQTLKWAQTAPDSSLIQIAKAWQASGPDATKTSADTLFGNPKYGPGEYSVIMPGAAGLAGGMAGGAATPGGIPAGTSPVTPAAPSPQPGAGALPITPAATPAPTPSPVPTTAPTPVPPPSAGTGPNYFGTVAKHESGGNPSATNPNGGAAGLYQFMPNTWRGLMQSHPELSLTANGATDPAQATRAMQAFTADNAKQLAGSGIAVNDKSLFMAHFLGAGGAAKFLSAASQNPNASAADLFPAEAKQNPTIFYSGGAPRSLGQVYGLMTKSFGNGLSATGISAGAGAGLGSQPMALPAAAGGNLPPPSLGLPATPAAALAPVSTPAQNPIAKPAPPQGTVAPIVKEPVPAPAPANAPAPGSTPVPTSGQNPYGTIAAPGSIDAGTTAPASQARPQINVPKGAIVMGQPMTVAQKAEQEKVGSTYGELPQKLDDAASAARAQNASLDQIENAADGWRMGKWADVEENARETMQAAGKAVGWDTSALDKPVANYQDFVKLSGQVLRQAAHDTSSRVGVQEMSLIAKSLPNPEMSEGGLKLVASQMKGLGDFAVAKQQAASQWRTQNGTLGPGQSGNDFQSEWNSNASPAAFVAHRLQLENPQAFDQMIQNMSKQPGGKASLKNLLGQMQWASQKGLLND